jgi:hypothetical protein
MENKPQNPRTTCDQNPVRLSSTVFKTISIELAKQNSRFRNFKGFLGCGCACAWVDCGSG